MKQFEKPKFIIIFESRLTLAGGNWMWDGAQRQFSLSVYKHVVSTLTYTGRGWFLLCDFSWGDIKKYLFTPD